MASTIVLHSGGLDSTVLLYYLQDKGHTLKTLWIDYGQKHSREQLSAKRICEKLNIEHTILDLQALKCLFSSSALVNDSIAVPKGPYSEHGMRSTVVPNRNMLFLSIAGAYAINLKYNHIAYAAHAGDHVLYPDCREVFAQTMDQALQLADWHPVSLLRPFSNMHKKDIVSLGATLGIPFEETWSCYNHGPMHCGQCSTCIERIEAFQKAGIPDPTPYHNHS